MKHFSCIEHTTCDFLDFPMFPQRQGDIVKAYSAQFHTFGQHDNALNLVLPYHPPELIYCFFHRTYIRIYRHIPHTLEVILSIHNYTLCGNVFFPIVSLKCIWSKNKVVVSWQFNYGIHVQLVLVSYEKNLILYFLYCIPLSITVSRML